MENEQKETVMSKSEEKVTIALMIIEIFIGLLVVLTIFLPALFSGSERYEGVFTTFGGGSNGGMITKFFEFSFMNFLSYFLVIAAMVITFVRLAVPRIDVLITKCITAGMLLLAGILFILCKQLTILNRSYNISKDLFTLSYGPVLAMIGCIGFIIFLGIDVWFARKISMLPAEEEETPKQLTEEELRAQVLAEIEAEKNAEAKEASNEENKEE